MILSAILFALLLGLFVFGVLPQASRRRRYVSVGLYIALIGVVYGGTVELMSRPKPVSLEWRDMAEASVVGAVPVEEEAIYVWLAFEGEAEPRAYALPWSMEAAQQLQQAMGEAEANGTGVMMSQPFEASLDDREPMFYAEPHAAMPEKDYAAGNGEPLVYVQPDSE